jgi:hypothetical protein
MIVITPYAPIKWVKSFAWLPVPVDAYRAADIRGGKLNYWVWLERVEWAEINIQDDDGRIRIVRRYRMAQK